MTTSLPSTSSNELFPGGSPLGADATALTDSLAAILAPGSGAPQDGASAQPAADFSTLLGDGSPAASVVAPAANPAGLTNVACTMASDGSPSAVSARTTDARGVAFVSAEADASASVGEGSATESPALPDRATLEAIIALLAPVVVAPEVMVAKEMPSFSSGGADGSFAAASLPAQVQLTVTLPDDSTVVFGRGLSPQTLVAPGEEPITAAEAVDGASAEPVFENVAAARLTAPSATTVPSTGSAAPDVAMPSESAGIEIAASVELADGAVVAIALPKSPLHAAVVAELRGSAAVSPEKSAGVSLADDVASLESNIGRGKNFLTSGVQGVATGEVRAGIAVAETRPTMFFTPHDTLPAVHSTVPALVSMVEAPQTAGAPAAEPMPQMVAASMARRAVETVTSVVDAQAASKLQPVPSVQLKFKVGTEDLSVRVLLRDGVVHTEFRTDSAELRAALHQEWKAVAAQPESALRFLEPVVSAASSTQSGTNSFAQQQQQSPGQSAAQQQQQQQQHQQTRAAAEFFGSVGRSTPFQPREGGAVAGSLPPVLPTSVHLSAVA
jgi:hypothetical protein